jgi:hypothetical protein
MKKAIAALSFALAFATVATPALARPRHVDSGLYGHGASGSYGHVNSGWGPPSNWNEIEISHPEGGG